MVLRDGAFLICPKIVKQNEDTKKRFRILSPALGSTQTQTQAPTQAPAPIKLKRRRCELQNEACTHEGALEITPDNNG